MRQVVLKATDGFGAVEMALQEDLLAKGVGTWELRIQMANRAAREIALAVREVLVPMGAMACRCHQPPPAVNFGYPV